MSNRSKIDFTKEQLEKSILSWFDGLAEAFKIKPESQTEQAVNNIFDNLQADINAAISKAKEEFKKLPG
jgi:hypothetical protein